jgi:hypothetical protein
MNNKKEVDMEENKSDGIYCMDIETLVNFFSYVAINHKTDETVTYVIWKERNDFQELLKHLKECKGMIGFNSISFDYPVLHWIMENAERLSNYSGNRLAKAIYKQAQNTINKEWSQVRKPFIPQLDLFKIWHFDNFARSTSLKKLEIALQMDNVADMPHFHGDDVTSQEQVDQILSYNLNDVIATKMFYEKTKDKIKLRKGLKKRYGLNCLNYSDSKIGEELMLKLYCEKTNQDPQEIKKLRTHRGSFEFINSIPGYVEFKTDEFNSLLEHLKTIHVRELKDSFKYTFEYKGFEFDLGTGGILNMCPLYGQS